MPPPSARVTLRPRRTADFLFETGEDLQCFAEFALCATWALWSREVPDHGSWGETPPWLELLALALAVVLGFIVGAVAGNRIGWLRHLFTPRRQMRDEVWSRAKQTFCDRRIYRTAHATGILIYVSRYERMAAIVADQTIVEKLGQPALDEICAHLTSQLGRQDPTAAICSAIEVAGQRLSACLPRAASDVNELDESLVILD